MSFRTGSCAFPSSDSLPTGAVQKALLWFAICVLPSRNRRQLTSLLLARSGNVLAAAT
jgi:hypothetical protein